MLAGGLALPPLFVLVFAGPEHASGPGRGLGGRRLPAGGDRLRLLPGALRRPARGDHRRPGRAGDADVVAGGRPGARHPARRRRGARPSSTRSAAAAAATWRWRCSSRSCWPAACSGAVAGTRYAPTLTRVHSEGRLVAGLRAAWRVPAVPRAADRLRRPGPGHRRDARRRPVLLRAGPRGSRGRDAAVRRARGAGDPRHAAVAAGQPTAWASGSGLLAARCCSPRPRVCSRSSGTAGRRPRSRSWSWSGSATPGCRCSRWRCSPT